MSGQASRLAALALAAALAAGAFVAEPIARSAALRSFAVDDVVRLCAEHGDGPRDYNAGRLEREYAALPDRLRRIAGALAAAAALHALASARWRSAVPLRCAVPLCGGLIACAVVAFEQTPIAARAIGAAVRADRFAAVHPDAAKAAAAVSRVVPDDARVLVIDFADPDHVHAFGYAAFPRRVYTPVDPLARFSAAAFRTLLRERPAVRAECAARGYAAAVDLRGLVTGDAGAIVLLEGGAERAP